MTKYRKLENLNKTAALHKVTATWNYPRKNHEDDSMKELK